MTLKADFLVQLDRNNFYTHTNDEGEPFGSKFPSCAAHLPYAKADAICKHFRQQGYAAIVTDLYGQPVSGADLQQLIASTKLFSIKFERPELYFSGRSAGQVIGTRSVTHAFKASLPLVTVIADDLRSAGYSVHLVENGDGAQLRADGDLRKTPLYLETMGVEAQQ